MTTDVANLLAAITQLLWPLIMMVLLAAFGKPLTIGFESSGGVN